MTITTEYQIVEKACSHLRAALGASVKVFDTVPFMPDAGEFDKLILVTLESAKVPYFWVVSLEAIEPTQFATMTQREKVTATAFAYMAMGDKPGVPDSDDPGVATAFASGTATGGATTTLTDSGAAFGTYANSHELWVTYSDGTVDHRRIGSNTGTIITVREAFGTAVAAGMIYEVWLRPTFWLLEEQARLVLNTLTTNRSTGGLAITGNTPGFKVEPVQLYGRGMWRASFPIARDLVVGKSYV